MSNEELKAVLKAAVEGLNTGFTAVVRTEEVTIAPYTTSTLFVLENQDIPGHGHSHGHGHGHGEGNAGGGVGELD